MEGWQIVMDNVRIPKGNMFPEVKGLKGPFRSAHSGHLLLVLAHAWILLWIVDKHLTWSE
jgi:hypothetical protein